ncbi:hypothetical protein C8R43DRAFT_1117620 [Mycena crocata]|nr:hypothetical protein C8R43DRAFT_1117620 [Mycena crocata]
MSAPQLSLSLPPNTTSFKRSFEQFGFDLESPASTLPHPAIDGSAASSESSSSATSPDGDENRRKRARSASSLSDPEDRSSEASTSTLSSFDSESVSTDSQSNSSQAAARRHLLLDLGLGRGLGSSVALGLSMASTELQSGGRAIEPPPRIPTPELLENNDVDMPDIDMSFSRHEVEEGLASPAEHVRRSVDRFNAFDRHISVLRSSSPPVIPLPASLSSRQASLSPPTLPPLPLVDLGLDAEDDEEEDDHEQFPSTGSTNTTTSTPPRLDLNLPSTTSLSSGPNSPTVPRDESSSTQFRERLDSVIDGLGGGDLHFEAPTTYESATSADDRNRHNESPGATASGSNAPAGNFPIDAFAHRRPLVEFDWPPSALDWNMTLGQPGGSAEAAQSPPWRPARATAATDTAIADIRRFIGSSSPPPPRLYPRPASLAAPLSVPATSSRLDSPGLDSVDLVGAYLDFRNSTNSRAWETALDRARALHRERERERDRERERRERERELEREREREREEETERERDHPWSLDSIWETNPRGESRELAAEGERELDLELARRRAMQRQLHLTLDRDRERQRDEQHARSQLATSVSRAERYLESGLVDPREASRPAPSTASLFDAPQAPERRLRPPSDTSNPFSVSWSSRRAREVEAEDPSSRPIAHRAMSSSQSELASDAWLDYLSRDRPSELDDFFHTEPASSRSTNPRSGPSSSVARDLPEYSRHGGETSASGDIWRARSTAVWQPRLAVSPQSTAQPTRTATHARAQSIATPTLSSMTAQPSIHRLRSRLYGPPRAAGVGSTNSLVAESAAAIRRREARSELMERLNRTISMDIDALSDPESDWEPFSTTPRASFPNEIADWKMRIWTPKRIGHIFLDASQMQFSILSRDRVQLHVTVAR